MRYTKDGRIDLSGITVYEWEIDYAIAHCPSYRDPDNVRRNIALGKHAAAYDWRPAWEWHQARVKVPA